MPASAERIRFLSMVDILESLPEEDIEQIDSQLSDIHLEAGEIFYTPLDRSQRLFMLQKGRVRVYKETRGRQLTLAIVEVGTIFGEMALTAQRLQGAYAQALEPSIVTSMSQEDLERLIVKRPQVGLQLVHLLSERLRSYESRIEDITLKDIHARLASLILLLSEGEGVMTRKEIKIPHHYTHERLGTMIGAKREAVTRAFSKLQDEGAVELKRRLIYISNIEALRRVANDASPQDINP
jgi:CRP/FNR family cyclic AMP-dependent transcriptional regulator